MVYKRCRNCNTNNSTDAEFCEKCEANLANAEIVSDEMIANESNHDKHEESPVVMSKEPEVEEQPAQEDTGNNSRMVKICDLCETENPPQARKCQNPTCSNDISDVLPVERKLSETKTPMLKSEDGTYIFAIPEGKTVIGRENAMRDYLEKRTFISRSHGIITNNKGVVYYEDTSKNGSVLNGNRVTQRIRLTNGDKLYLGHRCDVADNDTSKAAYFVFCL